MRVLMHKAAAALRNAGAAVRRGGFSISLALCLLMIGGAAYFVRSGVRMPTPASPQATVSPVAMSPPSVERLEDVLSRESEALKWPVSSHEILVPYSATQPQYNKTLDLWTLHEGVDILATPGEAVLSACDGTVASAHLDPLLGYVVEIRCDDGLTARYANLVSLTSVRHGERVASGQVIGSVGATAQSESLMKPHLHYEVYKDGKWALPDAEATLAEHEEYDELPS